MTHHFYLIFNLKIETKSDKKVSFNNTVNIKELHTEIEENQRNHEPLIINEVI